MNKYFINIAKTLKVEKNSTRTLFDRNTYRGLVLSGLSNIVHEN